MQKLKQFLKRVPGVYPAHAALRRARHAARSFGSPFVRMFPAGHFYSPLPDLQQVVANQERLFKRDVKEIPGVDIGEEGQLRVLDELAAFYKEAPFPEQPSAGSRYCYDNPFYKHGDSIVLYGMLRRLKPRRVIEVGSGFSSAAMLDTSDKFLNSDVEFSFVEPYPERLEGLLKDVDRKKYRIFKTPVQEVPLAEFERLEANDILFIDSSHVAKIGSDVRHLVWEVLPRLKAGVVVHVHDIFWPFEYPKEWVMAGNAWNEAYFFRTFLEYNSVFQIEYFNTYIATIHRAALEAKMPLCLTDPGGGLWMRKVS
jgi:predicted O-methyltransferase YrrM